jgi:hypothetical protein
VALLDYEWVISGKIGMGLSDSGQHTGQNLQPQVFLVPEAVGSALKNPVSTGME